MLLSSTKYRVPVALAALAVLCLAQDDQRTETKPKQQQGAKTNTTCGATNELVKRVEVCTAPLMDILQGTISKWPRTDRDIGDLCQSFLVSEKCIRENARKCATGLQRTIISTLATGVQRARKRECSPAKYPALLRTLMCVEKNQDAIHKAISNATSYLITIDRQIKDPNEKTMPICCMLHDIETAIETTLGPACPAEAKIVVGLYQMVLEDANGLICRAQLKCNGIFKGYKIERTDDYGGIIAAVLQIIISFG